jgi:hypothetical protein
MSSCREGRIPRPAPGGGGLRLDSRTGSDTDFVSNEPRLTAVPAARSRMPVLRIRLALVLGSLVAAAVLGLLSTLAWMTQSTPAPDLSQALPKGKGVATIAAEAWLDGKPIEVPALMDVALPETRVPLVHSDLTWEGFAPRALPSGVSYEVHRFLVVLPFTLDSGKQSNRVMRVFTTVAVTPDGRSYLAALPSMAPVDMRTGKGVLDYSDLQPKPLPSDAIAQIEQWADAWAADDRDQLKLLTGDTVSGVEYPGIGGFESTGSDVIAALSAGETAYGSDTYLVRVRISLASGGANQFQTETDMDLTMVDITTGLPRIVGWGPAGAGLRGPSETRQTS